MTACDPLELEILPPYIGSAVSPTVDITETTNDVTVTITDFRGEHSYTVEKTDQAIADAEQAASNANTAASNATSTANQAAQYARTTADQAASDAQETADEAAGRADTAAGGANQAAQAATTAAGTANTAAQNADAKAALADSKAALANTAATTANQAAQAAEAAKTAANDAAGQATTAAGNANTAAQTATTAAQNADAKAQLADTAAANADTAAANADTAAANADTATQAANTATTAANNAAQAANNAADVAIEAAEDMPRLIGTVDTAQAVADAWPTTMEGATVYGKCVQDGTPTPDNPVPVQVVSGTVNITINETVHAIDLQGHALAGLPDGTRDVLRVDSAGRVWIEQNVHAWDLGDFAWNNSSSANHIFRQSYSGITPAMASIPPAYNGYPAPALCDEYQIKGYSPLSASDHGCLAIGNDIVVAINHDYSDAAAFKAAMSGVLLYFKLATPQTIELGTITTPEIAPGDTLAIYASLDPEWAIEYTQDPSIVVNTLQASIAPVEGSTASTNYAVGAYLMHANQLYRVTSAIATGEAITPGTNCVECTVMGEVIRLTA